MVEITSDPHSMVTADARAAIHRALGDEHRIRLTDCLFESDRTPGELAELIGISSNLLAFHLRILEEAGVVDRRRSEGDSRRRYVTLNRDALAKAWSPPANPFKPSTVLFVCTHNSARSQFAEALWRSRGQTPVWSAGTFPADRIHPRAVETARRLGVDLEGMAPKGLESVPETVEVLISVCDRARESHLPEAKKSLHWSIPDPLGGGSKAMASAFSDIASRMERLITYPSKGPT